MKRIITNILFGLMFLVGFGILIYPTVSNQWNTYRQSKLITSYEEVVREMEEEDFSEEWALARGYNEEIEYNALYSDAFGSGNTDMKDAEYWKVLNLADDGIMGYISIPKINIKLAIYHGSEETVLQTGIGHIDGTKLPIGGESTHCVLSGHRGLPSARLFTDLDQMEKGDMFYIEAANINPQNLADGITVTVGELSVTYAPMDYIIRMYNKADTSAATKALVQALYDYYLAAVSYTTG